MKREWRCGLKKLTVFSQLRHFVFVDICDITEDQITFYYPENQETYLLFTYLLFCATV